VWITAYDPAEMYAAGAYVNQAPRTRGLATWVQANRSIDNRDIVLWYTLGVTHIPRPEDWPVMPVHRASFTLEPDGFFGQNPALDVPKPH
jgi:primary-amine oxidase